MRTTPNRGARVLMLECLETRRPLAADLQFTDVAPAEPSIQLAPPLTPASSDPVVRSSNAPGLAWSANSGRQNSLWLAPALITELPPYVPAGAMPTTHAELELMPVAPRSPLVLPPAPRMLELATATQWIEGDFDGDGVRELGQFANGKWWIDVDHNGLMDASDVWADFGQVGDKPVIADFNGDGMDEPAVATAHGMPRIGRLDFSEGNPRIVADTTPTPHELAAEPPAPAYRADSGEFVWHSASAPQVANRSDEWSR
ncbi:MAG: hypothetical protein KDB14_08410 [Planctomycetales bacterium]|nr:hypothetical protein [Planctomycetales bacterium]